MGKLRLVAIRLLIAFAVITPINLLACSTVGCLGRGVELKPGFSVSVKHDGRPLAGARVEITAFRQDGNTAAFSGVTTADGRVHVRKLAPGDYWIKADLLGIYAAYQCFHVLSLPTRAGKRSLTYDWGDLAPGTPRVAGRLIDSQPGTGGTPFWNRIHRVDVPVTAASFILRNALNGAAYHTSSDEKGSFSFDDIPPGTYVLHIEGGQAGEREYDSTDQLLKVSPKARHRTLLLTRRDGVPGSCGGTSLDLVEPPRE